ncbi:MAG: RpiB/LacA/LacB family sugar-phosphate isomerase [Pseudonocardiaceae bacterium]
MALLHAVRGYLGSDHAGCELSVKLDVFDVGDDDPPSCIETAWLAREHNDAQVVGVGARMHGPAGVAEIVEAFLVTSFSGGEWHARRIRLVSDFEAAGDAPLISAG